MGISYLKYFDLLIHKIAKTIFEKIHSKIKMFSVCSKIRLYVEDMHNIANVTILKSMSHFLTTR